MKVSPDRIKARAEQLRTQGFKVRGSMVRAVLELNAGARTQSSPSEERQREHTAEENNIKPAKAS